MFTLTYYTLQKIVSEQKHFIYAGKTAEDDCRCEKCENNELLLTTVKKKLASNQMQHFAEMVKIDAASFVESLICSIKNYGCCRGNCKGCVGLVEYQELFGYIKTLEEIQYCKWVCEENKWAKVNIIDTGLEFADVFVEIYKSDYKLYVYNIRFQHSGLKYTKQKLKENEVLFSVDFSKNYEEKKRMKFREHTSTMRFLHYTLLHVTLRTNCPVENVILIVIYVCDLW